MLRYFYILICIQLCFCTEYIDSEDKENEHLQRWVRSKPSKLHKKHTPSTKKSRLVQFDVQNFISSKDDFANYDPYSNMNKIRENRRVSAEYGDYNAFMESYQKNKERNNLVDYSNIEERSTPGKEMKARHSNFHSLSFDDGTKTDLKTIHSHDTKATSNNQNKLLAQDRDTLISDPERKCSYKHMKVPFFSYNKSTTKAKQKKRKIFCFNCHKTTTNAIPRQLEDNSYKIEEFSKEHHAGDRSDLGNKVSKRGYEQICPKCIRELLCSLRRKTTKKVKHITTLTPNKDVSRSTKEKTEKTTILVKGENLDDNLEEGYYNLGKLRKKRFDAEESERERRLKELEEVEKKIEDVHVTAPTFRVISTVKK